jgi:hypothetical protein
MSDTTRVIAERVPFLAAKLFDDHPEHGEVWVAVCQQEGDLTAGTSHEGPVAATQDAYEKRRAQLTDEIAMAMHKDCDTYDCGGYHLHLTQAGRVLDWADARRWHPYVREGEN